MPLELGLFLSAKRAIRVARDWLHDHSSRKTIPSGSKIHERYKRFRRALPRLCSEIELDRRELTYTAYCVVVSKWLQIAVR